MDTLKYWLRCVFITGAVWDCARQISTIKRVYFHLKILCTLEPLEGLKFIVMHWTISGGDVEVIPPVVVSQAFYFVICLLSQQIITELRRQAGYKEDIVKVPLYSVQLIFYFRDGKTVWTHSIYKVTDMLLCGRVKYSYMFASNTYCIFSYIYLSVCSDPIYNE